MTYRIKPLVWVQSRRIDWMWQVTAWVPYDIRCEGGIGYLVDYESETIAGPYDSLNEAKAAAQADYESRIRAALEPTDPPAAVLALPEIKALVDAVDAVDNEYSSQEYGPTMYTIENLRSALAALTKEGVICGKENA
jgi:hypothetical protein